MKKDTCLIRHFYCPDIVTWHRRLVQPIDVSLNNDQPNQLEPIEALTQDNAIVVGDRAYVTLAGMHPNTTYYVRIIPLDVTWDDMAVSPSGDFNYSESQMSAMVVVKTMPLGNGMCLVVLYIDIFLKVKTF